MEITQKHVDKLNKLLDEGLCRLVGKPVPGGMCVEAAVCYALDLPHGDDPGCVLQSVRRLKIVLNDSHIWKSNKARAEGLRRLAIAQLGSLDTVDEKEFVNRLHTMVKKTLNISRNVNIHAYTYAAAATIAAADAVAYAVADADAGEKILCDFAESVVQILIDLKSPGCKFL